MDNVTDVHAEACLKYLTETDKAHAVARAEVNALNDMTKAVLGFEFESAEGSAEARKAAAYRSDYYAAHIEKKKKAEIEYFEMDNRRKHAMLKIDVWRSLNANQRKGNI